MAKYEPNLDIDETLERYPAYDLPPRRRVHPWGALFGLVILVVIVLLGVQVVYAGKVYPGVEAAGVKVGGLSQNGAESAIKAGLEDYQATLVPINYGDTTLSISPAKIELKFNAPALAKTALTYGRRGSIWQRTGELLRILAGRSTKFVSYSYSDARLSPYLAEIDSELNHPVENASFNISGTSVTINPAQTGQRLNLGGLVQLLSQRLGNADNAPIDAPTYKISPVIQGASLGAVRNRAAAYVSGPLNLTAAGKTAQIDQSEIVSWLKLDRPAPRDFIESGNIRDLYSSLAPVTLTLDQAKIEQYVAKLAATIDQAGQNAALTITDGKATVFQPSRDGLALDQPKAVESIKAALEKSSADRRLALTVKVAKPEVTEDSLNDLGIKELLSEGFSTFPGSTVERLQNIRVGTKLYNGILLKPDQVFSFGEILGDVGPEQGYLPSLVIIGNKEEKQYGGGLCQVSSTAYRAALNAGLPILERTNHAFAVSYYTQPYGVPGVDATIYYPQVDFKFKNDTGHYILIQTKMEGSTLKFDFYGTKAKTGRIRGPLFVTGSLDDTKPSQTVFYRDVLDLAGNVMKTDTVNTFYKSSKDFTIVNSTQFH